MDTKNSARPSLKERAIQDTEDYLMVSLYLAFFFCALAIYTMMMLKGYKDSPVSFAFAFINAFVIGKVILIGEMAHFGKELENRPLYQSAIYKAFMFCLLALAFHFVEEVIKRIIHGGPFGSVLRDIRINDLIARSVVMFSTFLPLFAFRELRRLLGEEKFRALIFRSRVASGRTRS